MDNKKAEVPCTLSLSRPRGGYLPLGAQMIFRGWFQAGQADHRWPWSKIPTATWKALCYSFLQEHSVFRGPFEHKDCLSPW